MKIFFVCFLCEKKFCVRAVTKRRVIFDNAQFYNGRFKTGTSAPPSRIEKRKERERERGVEKHRDADQDILDETLTAARHTSRHDSSISAKRAQTSVDLERLFRLLL